MDRDRTERVQRLGIWLHMLRSSPDELLPPPTILKEFVRKLQQDIKEEARCLMTEEDHESAFRYLSTGINIGGYLQRDGYECDTTNDAKLFVLRAECANKLECYEDAVEDAKKALSITPLSIPAHVELVKGRHAIFRGHGPLGYILLADVFQNNPVPETVKQNPEVKEIFRQLDEFLKTQGIQTTTEKQKQDSRTIEYDWIPAQNRNISKQNKSVKTNPGKKRKAKRICDGAAPDLTQIQTTLPSTQRSIWPTQGAKPKASSSTASKSSPGKASAKVSTQLRFPRSPHTPKDKQNKASGSTPTSTSPSAATETLKAKQPVTSSRSQVNVGNIPRFRHRIKYVCGECFSRGHEVVRRPGTNPPVCSDPEGHNWRKCRQVVAFCQVKKSWCKVRPRNSHLQPTTVPTLCEFGDSCKRTRTDCWFPHFKEELDLWIYMGKYEFQELEKVMLLAQGSQEVTATNSKQSYPKSSAAEKPQKQPLLVPPQTRACSYCGTSYKESWQLEHHIKTPGHRSNVTLDTDKIDQWKYRDPPWNIANGEYRECQENKSGSCLLNSCTKAHSPKELEEWKERHQYRIMKMKKAKQQKLYAFMDEVLEKYNFSTSGGADVLAKELPGIRVKCNGDLGRLLDADGKRRDATCSCNWSFTLTTSGTKSLRRVCLLYDDNRLRFRLSQPAQEREAQVCPGNLIVEGDGKTWQINVIFQSQMLGSFSQWVLFDFGTEPHLFRKLQVKVGSGRQSEISHKINHRRQPKKVEVWTPYNSDIDRFYEDGHKLSTWEEELLTRYQVPESLGVDDLDELSRDNYSEYMHRMLYLEEQACNEKISKFSTESRMTCPKKICLETTTYAITKYSTDDNMFGKVDLKKALMDDSETSQIVERKVRKMMLRFRNSKKVYEAIIMSEQNDLGKDNQDTVYIELSPTCTKEVKLQNDTEYHVEIQLQLDRIPFCYMHSAVDGLQNMDIVFPPKENPQHIPIQDYREQSSLSQHQQGVVKFISEYQGLRRDHHNSGIGPVLVYGPFGTGKTHTLATAVQKTLEKQPESKILICTHSNSAADLYITEHLHRVEDSRRMSKIVRIYTERRNIKTIPQIILQKYTCIKDDKVGSPTTQEIKSSSVVITTLSMSHKLVSLKLHGHFTHILIDEAGQALETETLQPLTLATRDTCVVLAGDHLQISPKVFSQTARHAKFHISLLERLFYLKVGNVMLYSNYRMGQEMLDFISREFYYVYRARRIQAVFNQPTHPRYNFPLVFSVVSGEDEKTGMSYVNKYEVSQIVSSVKDLVGDWPEDQWGPLDAKNICVLTPYRMQVNHIRNELRKVGLREISVETVQNVQGKQYRVLIISTVRTRATLNKVDTTAFVSKISPVNRSDEIYDYGFLSDPRLLNTAFTRAQSMLMVVGDPKALCSIGGCSKIWLNYLKKCNENGTLLPLGTTIEDIQLETEAAKQRLNPNAPVFTPGSATNNQPVGARFQNDRQSGVLGISASGTGEEADSWLPDEDKKIPDGIIRELCRQISQDQKRLKSPTEYPGTDLQNLEEADIEREVRTNLKGKRPKFRMIEQDDRIVLGFRPKDRTENTVQETENEGGLMNDKHNERERRTAYQHVKERPDKYKICTFHCEKSGQTYAVPIDEGTSGKISITSKKRRGRALNLDEVIVEILDDLDDPQAGSNEGKKHYGKVLCICKRAAISGLMSQVVCKLDENVANQMVPVDRTLPKFFILTRDGVKTGIRYSPDFCTVSIYSYKRELQEDSPFLRNVEVSRKDRKHKLFLVQYVKWFADAPYPMGVVTEDLPSGDTRETGIRILKLMHGVKEKWKTDVIEKINEQFPDDWDIPQDEITSRLDVRATRVFTIDPPNCQDLDDALSIQSVGDNFEVGIHISDASYFISKDSLLDVEARNRSTSFYPPPALAKPINMLPEQLSHRLCSLRPKQDKLTVSVFVTLDKQGNVVADTKIVRSVIKSRLQLTYSQVEQHIKTANDDSEGTIGDILLLNTLAKLRRKLRLGVGHLAFSHDAEDEEAQHPLAHSLVEEMMLLANEQVARYLVTMYPDCTPLRRQLPPSEECVDSWLDKHGGDAINSLDLQSRPLPITSRNDTANDVSVLKEKWKQLRTTVKSDDAQDQMTKIIDLVTSDDNYPQLAVAKADLFAILETADYISTGSHPENTKRSHHSLDMPAYTHFTSPIRRYFDLVVHRMLIAALNDEKADDTLHQSERPYTTSELETISHRCNIQNFNSRAFEKKALAFQCALRLLEASQSFKAYVGGFSDSILGLIFPYRRFLPPKCHLKYLKPSSRPAIDDTNTNMELQWKEKVYELHGSSTPKPKLVSQLQLDPNQMVFKVTAEQWQDILAETQTEDLSSIKRVILSADREVAEQERARPPNQQRYLGERTTLIEEITCETSNPCKPSSIVSFHRTFKQGDVVEVQFNACSENGILVPSLQLFSLTPKFSLCVEHLQNAIESFAKVAARRPLAVFSSIKQYQAIWLPILEMVSAHSAVNSDESCIIHDLEINWQHSEAQHTGTFVIHQMFCSNRGFELHVGDYLCIRYRNVPLSSQAKHTYREFSSISSVTTGDHKTTFVAHAIIVAVTDIEKYTDDWTFEVDVRVNQHSAPFPDVLTRKNKVPTATVELIPKSSSDSRFESAVRRLDDAEPLVQGICLRGIPAVESNDPFVRRLLEAGKEIKRFYILESPFPVPNESQQSALRRALQQQFTIIQGPPGTGKTVTGAHLTHFFTDVNKQLPDTGRGPPQVLYCGPSNKAVNVVAHYLLRLGVSVVRVYNKMEEQRDYPIPSVAGRLRKTLSSMDPKLKEISLHYLIRQNSNQQSEYILEYERKFKHPGYVASFDELDEYKKTIYAAEAEEIEKYKVVLCTCNEAGSIRIQKNVNMIQCIVDEAGMCSEPETLIPLVGTMKIEEHKKQYQEEVKRNPRQVVLIGDHKQLRPIITERTAVQLGMEISLIEKYEEKATMLTIQYRMHESICAFPSETFYKGKLITPDIVKRRPGQRLNNTWPGGPRNPLVFCHHIGLEEKQSVRTEEGNEQSRANPQEVTHVVRIASVMVNRLEVGQDKIVVLTQYRLQRAQIAESLKKANLEQIEVSTVVTSQGREWDYVILSTVRSLPRVEIDEHPSTAWKKRNLGFITDENQTNVAITRPKMGLIIVGNKYLLRVHGTWKKLLAHYKEKNAVVDAEKFLPV